MSEQIYTRCPHCETAFRIYPDHLKIAEGKVRCGQCHEIFNALQFQMEELPEHEASQEENIEEIGEDELLHELEAQERAKLKSRQIRSHLMWGIVSIFLMGILAGQFIWFTQPNLILQHPQIRPLLETACEYLQCDLPATRNPDLFQVVKKYMDRGDKESDTVKLLFIFENKADFPQPYPTLEIRFEDEHKQLVGIRRFTPKEYLDALPEQADLSSGSAAQVELLFQNALKEMHTYGYEVKFL
ncbi:MAG: hypothetical protein RIT27_1746 [Pseudomonadota bacterium]|jgi:predicted Zn finger-like uncharacterized protein